MLPIKVFATRPAAVLQFRGEDHWNFLQSQGTADLRGPIGLCRHSLWLDHKGLIHGDAFVLRVEEGRTLLVSHETPATDLMDKFQKHLIADEVEMEDHTGAWKFFSIPSESASEFLKDRVVDLEPDRLSIEADGYLFDGHRLGPGTLEYLVPAGTELPFKVELISKKEAEAARIQGGIPSMQTDVGPGRFNPLEVNLLRSVSFDKGCYLGQEVVARAHRLQRSSKRLIRASGTGPPPTVPCLLVLDGTEVGELSSVAEFSDRFLSLGSLKSRIPDGEHAFDGLTLAVESLSKEGA